MSAKHSTKCRFSGLSKSLRIIGTALALLRAEILSELKVQLVQIFFSTQWLWISGDDFKQLHGIKLNGASI